MSGEVMSDQVMSCQFSSDQCRVKADHIVSGQDKVTSCQARPCFARRCHDIVRVGHVMSGQVHVRSGHIRSGQIVSG